MNVEWFESSYQINLWSPHLVLFLLLADNPGGNERVEILFLDLLKLKVDQKVQYSL